MLRRLGARLIATLDARSFVVHDATCWGDAKWDAETTGFATQHWLNPVSERHGCGSVIRCTSPLAGQLGGPSIGAIGLCLGPYDYIKNTRALDM